MSLSWQEISRAAGFGRLPAYFAERWAEFIPDEQDLSKPLLREADVLRYGDWFGFEEDWVAQIRLAAKRIDMAPDLKLAAVFLHWALFIARPFYEVPWFSSLATGALGGQAAMFGLCVLCREAPRTVDDLRRRGHPDPADVLRNFRNVGDYSRQRKKLQGGYGLGNDAWCALCVTPWLNTARHLRFAPAALWYDYTFYRHRESGRALVLAGGGLGLRADGLLPAEGEQPSFYTVYERVGERALAHRVSAAGHVCPAAEWFDLSSYEPLLRRGDILLGFHIPDGPGYDIPTCRASFKAALALFEKVYPEVRHKGFLCDSWLFSPHLQLMMRPEDSRILRIQREMHLIPIHSDREAFAVFLYGLDSLPPPDRLPADTRLRALVRDWLLAGRHLSVGGALLPLADWQRFGQTPYFREEDLAAFRKLAGQEVNRNI